MIALGIGCRRDVAAATIERLVREVLRVCDGRDEHAVLFTHTAKRGEQGLREAATLLGLPLVFLSERELQVHASLAVTRSRRVERLFGVPSVAETAALAGAGVGAALIQPRLVRDGVTCAAARPGGACA